MTTTTEPERIALRSDYEGYVKIRRRHPTTGKLEPATGLVGVTMYFALTRGGAALHADVEFPLPELAGQPGGYLGVLDAAAVTLHLEPLGEWARLWKAIVKPGDRTVWEECVLVHDEI